VVVVGGTNSDMDCSRANNAVCDCWPDCRISKSMKYILLINLGVARDAEMYVGWIGLKYDDQPIIPRPLKHKFIHKAKADRYTHRLMKEWERLHGRVS
jgi:hypothetical protein